MVLAYSSRRTRTLRVLLKSTPGSSRGRTTRDAYESKLSGCSCHGRLPEGPSSGCLDVTYVPRGTQQTETFSLMREK